VRVQKIVGRAGSLRLLAPCWIQHNHVNPTTCCVLSTLEAQLGGMSKQPYEHMLTTPLLAGPALSAKKNPQRIGLWGQ
jgi:hypothetical protein